MENIRYSLTLVGTYYTLEQLAQISSLPGGQQASAQNVPADDDSLAGQPAAPLAQIAFAGRSNVGKSSLINALAGRKQLAKVSATPGKTASVNFYKVDANQPDFPGYYLVDLPGYGYAQRSKSEREKWARLIDSYLRNTDELRALAVLLDCRLEPQNSDLELIDFARSIGLQLLPVLTKADKCKQNERAKRVAQWTKLLNGQAPVLTASTSGASGRIGITELWKAMTGIATNASE